MSAKPLAFKSLKSPALLQEQVYRQVTHQLVTGRLKPGQKLVIRTLSQAMGTSPMPVRDALQRLAAQGVLTGKRSLEVPVLSEQEITDILAIRLKLEQLAAERAVERATDTQLRGIEKHYRALEDAALGNRPHDFLQCNALFHLHIAELAHSPSLYSTIEPLWLKLGPALQLLPHEQEHLPAVLPVHRRIVDALIQRNARAAQQAIYDDLMGNLQNQLGLCT
jgi:DNA-binding GntR family transcriptional regulator